MAVPLTGWHKISEQDPFIYQKHTAVARVFTKMYALQLITQNAFQCEELLQFL